MIKEGFFRNYELAQLPPLARILFEGLWCLADKNGRLWDRPQQIKAECLPYDDCDIENLLLQLADARFIHRYEVSGKRCIQVINFEKHQILTTWEKNTSSDVPPPKGFKRTSKVLQNENEVDLKSFRSTSTLNIHNNEQNSSDQNSNDQNNNDLPFHGVEFVSAFTDFERHRKEIRKPLRPTSRRRLLKKLEGWGESVATEALLNSVEHSWIGVFEPNGNGNVMSPKSKADRSMAAVNQVLAEKEAQRDATRS